MTASTSASAPASGPEGDGLTPLFSHEKLDVYQTALHFVVLADGVASAASRGRSYLADQLRRAATSIPLNIAEGAGEFSRRDKARFYRIARRSAAECAAILDVCRHLNLAADREIASGKELLNRIAAMLTRLASIHTKGSHSGDPSWACPIKPPALTRHGGVGSFRARKRKGARKRG